MSVRAFHWSILSVSCLLAACSSPRLTPAPIIEGNAPVSAVPAVVSTPVPAVVANTSAAGAYTVKKGDTLYRIAAENKVSYQDVMAWNHLADPNIKIGQVLQLSAPLGEGGVTITPLAEALPSPSVKAANTAVLTKTAPKAVKEVYTPQLVASMVASDGNKVATKQQSIASSVTASGVKPIATVPTVTASPNPNKSSAPVASSPTSVNTSGVDFGIPTSGKVVRGYSEVSKGVDIAGKLGQSIVASAQGKVVYAGTGLRGYGKMVILQHSNGYLTAYAHNDKLLVKEGDVVKKGEKIAEMGKTDADQVKLHFEIRKGGKPIDPGKFIATE
ncbi:peptidoglycan DD-metalloendopeptidase family protein [Chitinibacter fontanus]|uniref:Peptidoglycan DD-metalloendopeptidase family protein n=1 Tax=Chitinibacter fontanus TaxID=1737446 RepID=A0A7D5ZJV3_9NEIS|nr:peptidoglycan DD-metalloendopeptidase family protein [Chitinibacter fontanus]QLI83049.1 peptidoglycan DD-metalloendopeptidase family protein [Chitinibacter fontanus]